MLNAFRHHRGGHGRGRRVGRPHQLVLNAFRHHRGGHGSSPPYNTGFDGCSTPFGITEGGIHGFAGEADARLLCSTPFGITEGGMKIVAPSPGDGR